MKNEQPSYNQLYEQRSKLSLPTVIIERSNGDLQTANYLGDADTTGDRSTIVFQDRDGTPRQKFVPKETLSDDYQAQLATEFASSANTNAEKELLSEESVAPGERQRDLSVDRLIPVEDLATLEKLSTALNEAAPETSEYTSDFRTIELLRDIKNEMARHGGQSSITEVATTLMGAGAMNQPEDADGLAMVALREGAQEMSPDDLSELKDMLHDAVLIKGRSYQDSRQKTDEILGRLISSINRAPHDQKPMLAVALLAFGAGATARHIPELSQQFTKSIKDIASK